MKLKFKIALVNVFWSENDINTRFFESVEDQTAYFDELTRGKFSDLVNFNMGNNIETAVTYLDKSGRSVSELVSCNYAVVQEVDEEGSFVKNRYFFAYPSQDSNNQMRVTLSLDDIQTNYFPYKNQIAPCLIRRANLNRFVDNGDDTISFNGDIDSPLFFTEPIQNVGKRMTKRTKLNLFPGTNEGNAINEWLKENVLGWEYIYLTQGEYSLSIGNADTWHNLNLTALKQYPFENFNIMFNNEDEGNAIPSALVCVCFPVYKRAILGGRNNCIHLLSSGNNAFETAISSLGMTNFYTHNNNKSNVYARKFSTLSPFWTQSWSTSSCYVDSNNNLIIKGSAYDKFELNTHPGLVGLFTGKYTYNSNQYNCGIFQVEFQTKNKALSEEYSIDKQLTFQKSEIVGALKNSKFNPKLLSSQFFELNIVLNGQKFGYDIQKLNKDKIKVSYSEAFSPDISKVYARIHDTQGIYIPGCEENLTGLVYSNDNSLMVDNDKLSEMLANNKNFFLQQALQIGKATGESVSAIKSARFDKPVETIFEIVDKVLTLDNMRNAPNQVQNANGNVYFNTLITAFSLYIEEYDLLDIEKESINDLMFQFGFAYNKIDNISNYDNIRKYFNYIEADVENISAPISNTEKERLKQKLKSIRFWNDDVIQYTYENYERGLEDA